MHKWVCICLQNWYDRKVLMRNSGPPVLRFTNIYAQFDKWEGMINNEWKTPILCFSFLCLILEIFLFFVQCGITNLDVTQMEAATLCEPEERL